MPVCGSTKGALKRGKLALKTCDRRLLILTIAEPKDRVCNTPIAAPVRTVALPAGAGSVESTPIAAPVRITTWEVGAGSVALTAIVLDTA
jgi:hypothetical protein